MGNKAYSDKQRAEYLELAAEIGITRAKRELGYPAGWGTAQRWVQAAGIEVPLDEIKAQAKAHHDWYETEDMLLIAMKGLARVAEAFDTANELTPDDQKKLAEAYQKHANTWLLLQGKANNINETRHKDNTDLALMELLNEESVRNEVIEQNVTTSEKEVSPTRA